MLVCSKVSCKHKPVQGASFHTLNCVLTGFVMRKSSVHDITTSSRERLWTLDGQNSGGAGPAAASLANSVTFSNYSQRLFRLDGYSTRTFWDPTGWVKLCHSSVLSIDIVLSSSFCENTLCANALNATHRPRTEDRVNSCNQWTNFPMIQTLSTYLKPLLQHSNFKSRK